MKKIMTFILLAAMLTLTLPFPISFAETSDSFKADAAKLTAFGFLQGSTGTAKTEMTKFDYFSAIYRMLNRQSIEELSADGIVAADKYGTVPDLTKISPIKKRWKSW